MFLFLKKIALICVFEEKEKCVCEREKLMKQFKGGFNYVYLFIRVCVRVYACVCLCMSSRKENKYVPCAGIV